MSLKASINLLKSSSFRFALLTGFTIWFTTSLVLILVYFKLENTIWTTIDRNLDRQTEQVLASAAAQPDIDTRELVAAFNIMTQPNAISIQHQAGDMMAMHNSPAMQALHGAMGVANPPQRMVDDRQALTQSDGILQFTREVTLPNGETVAISQNIEYLNDLQTSLWQSLIFGLSITLLVAIGGAILLTQRSLRRIQEINLACQTIIDGDFSHRIPYQAKSDRLDDYDRMAMVINQMLDEIGQLIVKVRQVTDNVAHDLKSPLARLRAQLETAATQYDSPLLDNGIAEVDRLLGMIKSLLGIARIESLNQEGFSRVEMQPLINDLLEMYRPVFDDAGISLTSQLQTVAVKADKHLVYQALANLLDNALKFSPSGGQVSLTLKHENDDCVIILHDSGPGLDDPDSTDVFERFYRENKARNTSGFGLGLSLVKAIVKLHNGRIRLTNDDGLVVTLRLPAL